MRFPWKGLLRKLFRTEHFYTLWPETVPMPPTGSSTKGISELARQALYDLAEAFQRKFLTLEKRTENTEPVTIDKSEYRVHTLTVLGV